MEESKIDGKYFLPSPIIVVRFGFMSSTVKLNDKVRGAIQLNVADGRVVSAMGSEPARYVGLTLEAAKHLARYGGFGKVGARLQAL